MELEGYVARTLTLRINLRISIELCPADVSNEISRQFSGNRSPYRRTLMPYANSIEIATATMERRGVSDSAGKKKKKTVTHVYLVALS